MSTANNDEDAADGAFETTAIALSVS